MRVVRCTACKSEILEGDVRLYGTASALLTFSSRAGLALHLWGDELVIRFLECPKCREIQELDDPLVLHGPPRPQHVHEAVSRCELFEPLTKPSYGNSKKAT